MLFVNLPPFCFSLHQIIIKKLNERSGRVLVFRIETDSIGLLVYGHFGPYPNRIVTENRRKSSANNFSKFSPKTNGSASELDSYRVSISFGK